MPYGKPAFAPDWIRLREAAQELGCAPNTLRCWIKDGKLAGVRVIRFDGALRLHRDDWARHIQQRLVQPEKAA